MDQATIAAIAIAFVLIAAVIVTAGWITGRTPTLDQNASEGVDDEV